MQDNRSWIQLMSGAVTKKKKKKVRKGAKANIICIPDDKHENSTNGHLNYSAHTFSPVTAEWNPHGASYMKLFEIFFTTEQLIISPLWRHSTKKVRLKCASQASERNFLPQTANLQPNYLDIFETCIYAISTLILISYKSCILLTLKLFCTCLSKLFAAPWHMQSFLTLQLQPTCQLNFQLQTAFCRSVIFPSLSSKTAVKSFFAKLISTLVYYSRLPTRIWL